MSDDWFNELHTQIQPNDTQNSNKWIKIWRCSPCCNSNIVNYIVKFADFIFLFNREIVYLSVYCVMATEKRAEEQIELAPNKHKFHSMIRSRTLFSLNITKVSIYFAHCNELYNFAKKRGKDEQRRNKRKPSTRPLNQNFIMQIKTWNLSKMNSCTKKSSEEAL